MLIRVTTSLAGLDFALSPGEERDFPEAEAISLIKAGFAVPVEPPVERAVRSAPERRKK